MFDRIPRSYCHICLVRVGHLCRIEGSDKIFYNAPSMYVYQSTIVPLLSGASIVYSKGSSVGGTFYNSTVVFDTSSIVQKTGNSNTGVFLGAPNGAGAVAIYRNVAMGNLISNQGVHPTGGTVSSFYGEFANTGPGSYASNTATRPAYDHSLSADQVSQYTIDNVFGNAFPPYGSPSTSWVDSSVLLSIAASDAAQLVAASSATSSSMVSYASTYLLTTSSSATSGSSMILPFPSVVPNITVSATASVSSISLFTPSMQLNTTASISTSASASPTIPSCKPSATLTVSKQPGVCDYGNVSAAIAAIPNDSKAYTVMVGPGVYNEQISINRNGKVTLIGATNFTRDYTQNQVTIQTSNGALTSAGQNENTPVIYAKKANDNSGLAVYNINFANTYPQTPNTAALAADFYGTNIAAYGCSFTGFQDTLLANKGTQVFSNCYIEGCA